MTRPRKAKNIDLPPYLYRRGKSYLVSVYNPNTRRLKSKRLCSLDTDWATVIKLYRKAVEFTAIEYLTWDKKLMWNVRKNAKTRGIDVLITEDDIRQFLKESGGKCSITGVDFSEKKPDGARIRPWIPSVDRIDSSKPYTVENCRIVCAAVNYAMNEFGEEIVKQMALGYSSKLRKEMNLFDCGGGFD